MPSLNERAKTTFVKMLYIGDSSTGKTGSLVSLVEAGYKLRIIDLDNGINTLAQFVAHKCPDKLANVEYEAFRDRYKTGPGGVVVDGIPTAFKNSMQLLDKWTDGSVPSTWGKDTVLVIDSLTALGRAALNWFERLNPNVKDNRQNFYAAQTAVEEVILNVTADEFRAHVIIISHVDYNEERTKGYTSALGKALGPKLARHFNNLILAESRGSGDNVKRIIRTAPTGVVDLKTEAPFKVDKELPLSSGLATMFDLIRGEK